MISISYRQLHVDLIQEYSMRHQKVDLIQSDFFNADLLAFRLNFCIETQILCSVIVLWPSEWFKLEIGYPQNNEPKPPLQVKAQIEFNLF